MLRLTLRSARATRPLAAARSPVARAVRLAPVQQCLPSRSAVAVTALRLTRRVSTRAAADDGEQQDSAPAESEEDASDWDEDDDEGDRMNDSDVSALLCAKDAEIAALEAQLRVADATLAAAQRALEEVRASPGGAPLGAHTTAALRHAHGVATVADALDAVLDVHAQCGSQQQLAECLAVQGGLGATALQHLNEELASQGCDDLHTPDSLAALLYDISARQAQEREVSDDASSSNRDV